MLFRSNGSGDGHWHLTVHDGSTGAVKADLIDEHLQGALDVDGDGVAELLTVHTSGAGIPNYGSLHVWSLKVGKPVLLWEGKRMAWQMATLPQPLHINSGATFSGQDILARRVKGYMRIVLRQPKVDKSTGGQTQLSLYEWRNHGFAEIKEAGRSSKCVGVEVTAVAMDAEGNVLVRSQSTNKENYGEMGQIGRAHV